MSSIDAGVGVAPESSIELGEPGTSGPASEPQTVQRAWLEAQPGSPSSARDVAVEPGRVEVSRQTSNQVEFRQMRRDSVEGDREGPGRRRESAPDARGAATGAPADSPAVQPARLPRSLSTMASTGAPVAPEGSTASIEYTRTTSTFPLRRTSVGPGGEHRSGLLRWLQAINSGTDESMDDDQKKKLDVDTLMELSNAEAKMQHFDMRGTSTAQGANYADLKDFDGKDMLRTELRGLRLKQYADRITEHGYKSLEQLINAAKQSTADELAAEFGMSTDQARELRKGLRKPRHVGVAYQISFLNDIDMKCALRPSRHPALPPSLT